MPENFGQNTSVAASRQVFTVSPPKVFLERVAKLLGRGRVSPRNFHHCWNAEIENLIHLFFEIRFGLGKIRLYEVIFLENCLVRVGSYYYMFDLIPRPNLGVVCCICMPPYSRWRSEHNQARDSHDVRLQASQHCRVFCVLHEVSPNKHLCGRWQIQLMPSVVYVYVHAFRFVEFWLTITVLASTMCINT